MKFDPFQDRLSRDIRNGLAGTLREVLDRRDLEPAWRKAQIYLMQEPETTYREYILDRLRRYQAAVDLLGRESGDVLRQALVLWDLELFYEVHEVLEYAWLQAKGSRKKLLQAVILAAAVYIKLAYGYHEPARKIARRAIPALKEHHEALARYFEPEKLLLALRKLDERPPRLLA